MAEGGLEEPVRAHDPKPPASAFRPDKPDPDHYSSRYAHCDVLVLGGGAAGLAAALAAAETGVRVILADEQAEFGGSLRFETGAKIDGQDGFAWAQAAIARLRAMDNVRVLSRTTAFGYYAQNFVGLVERVSDHLKAPGHDLPRERLWQVRAKRVVLASGAIERHMVFANNDRPGIMLAGAARTFLNQYGVAVGRSVGVYTANDPAYAAAIDLKKAGVNVAAIVDLRDNPTGPVIDEARALGSEPSAARAITRLAASRGVVDDRAAQEWRRRTHHSRRCDPDVSRLDAVGAPVLAVTRQGRLQR